MELQLGLAPPIHNPVFKGFDLNYNWFDPKQTKDVGNEKNVTKKRCFSEAFDESNEDDVKPILCLPLLLWNDEPNEENDDHMVHKKSASYKNDEEENNIVGWPPIQSWRKKTLFMNNNQQQTRRIQTPTTTNKNVVDRSSSSKSKYVKVKMEGFSIGRKINLKNYHSYETLLKALICLFTISCSYYQEGYECKSCVLTYQDKEGDWHLAGDVPWKSFIDMVQRLEISTKGTIASG